jgi:hypothetical protein
MFSYSDPTGTGFLQQAGALQAYRDKVRQLDEQFDGLLKSGFTLRESFEELTPANAATVTTVRWKAFPITHNNPPNVIDSDRLENQDEYVEWRVETKPDNSLAQVTFTTEFSEYFQALAEVGADTVRREIQNLYPGANPTDQELFGPNFNPSTASPNTRGVRFRNQLPSNPWNNGQKGILCLTQRFNTLGALFNLLGACGVPNTNIAVDAVCANVNGACGPGRNSDPQVCSAAQNLARGKSSFSLQDPAGIHIIGLDDGGLWTVDGEQVAINDPVANKGVWKVTRNGRRAVFSFQRQVKFAGASITSGAQLSNLLFVGADVIHAPDAALPEWARAGNERTRMPVG